MENKHEYIFEKLTPISDSELGIYEDALNFVFQNDDVRNIAISGAYGAGKSSVLSSYKSKHSDKKYIHISLAHFSNSNDNGKDILVKESVLEGKILNQLIHQIPAEKIPQTNFRVKKTIDKCQLMMTSAVVFLLLLLGIMFLLFSKWTSFVNSISTEWINTFLKHTTTDKAHIAIGILFAIFIFVLIYKIVKMQKNRNIFRKFSFQGNEIEIFEESEDSYFDKYLNEVLYLFENVEDDVIVFEDMDRFDVYQIFERLREINTLTNLQRKKDGKKIIRFFYLLRDDVFVSKDRTKFFDYIVPVVPVVDSSNSYNQFISHLRKNDLYDKFDESFLQGLSLYVDDMRLLKNICNEFLIYYNRLNTTELDYNKMMALIVYKNLFPRDYSDLQLNNGFVYALFSHKADFIKSERVALQEEIEEKQAIIDSIRRETLESVQELDEVYAGKRALANGYTAQNAAAEWRKNEYPKRKKAIENRDIQALNDLEESRAKLQHKLTRLNELPLCRIISRENINSIFRLTTETEIGTTILYNEIKESPYFDLLKFLIRNGYIDESYTDYMTYFYEDSLSRIDKIFLRSVTDKRAKDYTYALKNPKMVFERLRPVDFDQEETLNNILIDYLVRYAYDSEQLSRLIDQLKESKKYDFIEQYFDATTYIADFISILNAKWPELFADILHGSRMSTDHIRRYTINTLYYSDDTSILIMDTNGVLSNYISEANDYLAIDTPDIERLLHGFSVLNVFFHAIDYDASNRELFEAVYTAGQYAVNYQNIELMLLKIYGIPDKEEIRKKTTTLILRNNDSPLSKKIREDMSSYLGVILAECAGKITDDELIVIEVLNDFTISREIKNEYINALQTKIKELTSIQDKELWGNLISAGVVKFSEENVAEYFLHAKELDTIVINYINGAKRKLNFSTLGSVYDAQKEELFNDFVKCDGLNDEQYENAVTSLNRYYPKFNIEGISDSKMRILIAASIIRMNVESLKFIRENYPEVLLYYIEEKIDEYIKIIDKTLFSQDELMEVLLMDVDDENKLKLLTLSTLPISIVNKSYPIRVREYILLNNLCDGDLPILYNTYSQHEIEIQKIIFSYALQYIYNIIGSPRDVDSKLKEEIMMSSEADLEDKIELLISDFPNLNQIAVSNYLRIVDKEDFIKIFDPATRPHFSDDDTNRRLLQAFIDRGWMYDYYSEADHLKIRRHEPKKSDK